MFNVKYLGRVFDQEYGYIVFPKRGFSMKVRLADVRIAIFLQSDSNYLGRAFDTSSGVPIEIEPRPIEIYSFIYKLKNEDQESGGMVSSFVNDEWNHCYMKTDKLLESRIGSTIRFIEHEMMKAEHSPRLVYYGARNEG